MKPEHEQVLKTMNEAGLLSRQAMKSIRGQIKNLAPDAAEDYLKKLIRRKGNERTDYQGRD